jgi:lysophospholipase L1-like esterase
MQFAAALRTRGVAMADPDMVATSGWTTDELSAAIDATVAAGALAPPYDLVSLAIGVNDQYRGRPVADYAPAFAALLTRAVGFAGGDADRVFVASIPDWGVTPFAIASGRHRAHIAAQVDEYNAMAAATCVLRGIPFVDVTVLSRRDDLRMELVEDGLHPSARQYAAWVEAMLASLPARFTAPAR